MLHRPSSASSCATSGALALRRSASSASSSSSFGGALAGAAAAGHLTRVESLGFGSRTHDRRALALSASDASFSGTAQGGRAAHQPPREPTNREMAEKEAELARVIAAADVALAESAFLRAP